MATIVSKPASTVPTTKTSTAGASQSKSGGFLADLGRAVTNLFSGSGTSGSRSYSSGTSSGMESEARRLDTTPRSGLGNLWYSLTSNDPGNVARNRAAAARYAAMPNSGETPSWLNSPIRSQNRKKKNRFPVDPFAADNAPVDNAPLPTQPPYGSPTIPMGPVEVATPSYGLASLMPQTIPYGSALSSIATQPMYMPQYEPINYADIFALPADLSFMYR